MKKLLLVLLALPFIGFGQNTYKSIDSVEYSIGDVITFGKGNATATGSKYSFISYTGIPNDTTSYFRSMPRIPNSEAVIQKIKFNYGAAVIEALSSSNYYYRIKVDNAILYSEMKSNNSSFRTSDEAILELKKAKENLDLGLITQQDYNATLKILKEYIKQ
jgi:hypothetical protein